MSNSVNSAEVARVLATIAGALTGPNSQPSESIQGVSVANVPASISNQLPTIVTGTPSFPPPSANALMTGPSHVLTSRGEANMPA